MKIYHGTSFENACRIMSSEFWEYPIELYLKSEYEICKKMGKPFKHVDPNPDFLGNHFSSSLKYAEEYALQNERPVILTLEWDKDSCSKDFIIKSKIDVSKIHALDNHREKYGLYGIIINALYKRKNMISGPKTVLFPSPIQKDVDRFSLSLLSMHCIDGDNYSLEQKLNELANELNISEF